MPRPPPSSRPEPTGPRRRAGACPTSCEAASRGSGLDPQRARGPLDSLDQQRVSLGCTPVAEHADTPASHPTRLPSATPASPPSHTPTLRCDTSADEEARHRWLMPHPMGSTRPDAPEVALSWTTARRAHAAPQPGSRMTIPRSVVGPPISRGVASPRPPPSGTAAAGDVRLARDTTPDVGRVGTPPPTWRTRYRLDALVAPRATRVRGHLAFPC